MLYRALNQQFLILGLGQWALGSFYVFENKFDRLAKDEKLIKTKRSFFEILKNRIRSCFKKSKTNQES